MLGIMLDSDAMVVAVEYSCCAGEARKVTRQDQHCPFQGTKLQGKAHIVTVTTSL
jgi:hypothetical protein